MARPTIAPSARLTGVYFDAKKTAQGGRWVAIYMSANGTLALHQTLALTDRHTTKAEAMAIATAALNKENAS